MLEFLHMDKQAQAKLIQFKERILIPANMA